ncbi:MAG TPA: class I SAM-dependent methyltransferase [Afifellaceae bacterium]|nr:class I SAM-dependent methyltransferase [Afifellaceae bacterium]
MDTLAQPNSVVRISGCEVCGGAELVPALDLGSHPLCDDLIAIGEERQSAEYPISISYCRTCKTAHQQYQVPKRILFPESYHYRARHTADVLTGMDQLVQSCDGWLGDLRGVRVLDIGCNDGSLLTKFAQRGAVTFGIEPTGAATDAEANGHVVYQDYLTPQVAERFLADHPRPQIITFTNVFAHIEDLRSVLGAVKALMAPETLLVVENHYLGAVLERYQFDTFYHEHPRTYSLTSFKYVAEALGARIVRCEFPARYGGNIRVMMQIGAVAGAAEDAGLAQHLGAEESFERQLRDMAGCIPAWRSAKRAELEGLVAEHGPLPGKAFPGRAAILVKLLGLDDTMISAVYEKPGSMKVGHYLPGTRIPIRSDEEFDLQVRKEGPLLNLAWHISAEINRYMRGRGFTGPIVDIFRPEELGAGR